MARVKQASHEIPSMVKFMRQKLEWLPVTHMLGASLAWNGLKWDTALGEEVALKTDGLCPSSFLTIPNTC